MKYGEALKNIWKAVSTEDSRYMLRAIKIDAEKEVAVATDGHVLCAIDITTLLEPGEKSFLLPPEAIKAARQLYIQERARYRSKLNKDKARPVFMRGGADAVTVFVGESKRGQSYDVLSGTYPTWEAECPKPEGYEKRICLSVGLLTSLVAALQGSEQRSDGVTLYAKTEADPILVSTTGRHQGYGLLMPMRADHGQAKQFWVPKV